MPEIQLPTAAKQDEILQAVNEEVNYDNILTKTTASSYNLSTVLEVTGSGILHFLSGYFNNSANKYTIALKITIDGHVILDESKIDTTGQSALIGTESLTDIFTTSSTYGNSFYVNTPFFDNVNILPNCWKRRYKNPLIFKNALKIEVRQLTTNIAYELT